MKYKIGIDLGTTNSVVAVYRNNTAECLKDPNGKYIVPSVIYKTTGRTMVGTNAKKELIKGNPNVIHNIKRIIGRTLTQAEIDIFKKKNKFGVELDAEGKIKINNELRDYECSSLILEYLVTIAENYLNQKIESVIITVPTRFGMNEAEREATKRAGEILGLKVDLLDEPVAAALAFGLDQSNENLKVLVFDYGGGTLDLTVACIKDRNVSILAKGGNRDLGGEDMTNAFMDQLIESIDWLQNSINNMDSRKAKQILKAECEKAKIILSKEEQVEMDLSLGQHNGDKSIIYRSEFEFYCEIQFEKVINELKYFFNTNPGIKKNELDQVILVGGSTKIPKIRKEIAKFFNGVEINVKANPDLLIAKGAAIFAGMYNGSFPELNDFNLDDIIPFDLGFRQSNGTMGVIASRHEKIPFSNKGYSGVESANQNTIKYDLYEGNDKYVKNNTFLGQVELKNINQGKDPNFIVEHRFTIDAFGKLEFYALDRSTGKKVELNIQHNIDKLNPDEIDNRSTQIRREFERTNNTLYRWDFKRNLERAHITLTTFDKINKPHNYDKLVRLINKNELWLSKNWNADNILMDDTRVKFKEDFEDIKYSEEQPLTLINGSWKGLEYLFEL